MSTPDQRITTTGQLTSAATDVGEFVSDLDGGMAERMLSIALSQTAAAVVDHAKKGSVSLTLTLEHIPGTHQVHIAHEIKFSKPTSTGKSSEETAGKTAMFVGKFGALSLAQTSLLDNAKHARLTD